MEIPLQKTVVQEYDSGDHHGHLGEPECQTERLASNSEARRFCSEVKFEEKKSLYHRRTQRFRKTTFAKLFLPEYVNCPNFVNADLIAQGLAPFEPRAAAIKAGKLVLQQIHEYARRGFDFAFETTLSGKSYAKLLSELKSQGYSLHLFFLWIPSPELAIARIKDRVERAAIMSPRKTFGGVLCVAFVIFLGMNLFLIHG